MIPWTFLDSAQAPGNGGELKLYQRGAEFSIRVEKCELMNSRHYGSEDALAELSCKRITDRPHPRVLIGGLGMGYTLRAALNSLKADGKVVVAELVPAVVVWNRGPLAELAKNPLKDPRVIVRENDVGEVMREKQHAYDAIMLDVDNGPEGLTRKGNDWLYGLSGLKVAYDALRPRGVLAVWSAGTNDGFVRRLRKIGFKVDEVPVRSRGARGGARYTVWLAQRGE
jgi:spermidine synthase